MDKHTDVISMPHQNIPGVIYFNDFDEHNKVRFKGTPNTIKLVPETIESIQLAESQEPLNCCSKMGPIH